MIKFIRNGSPSINQKNFNMENTINKNQIFQYSYLEVMKFKVDTAQKISNSL